MHTQRRHPRSQERVMEAAQYADLRAELQVELARLVSGTSSVDDKALRDLGPRARRRALQINEILRRMDSDSFGVCVTCQSRISYERLSVIPETIVCAHCRWHGELSVQR